MLIDNKWFSYKISYVEEFHFADEMVFSNSTNNICVVHKMHYFITPSSIPIFIIMSPSTKGMRGRGRGWGGTYCFWDGSRWRQHKSSCPLCNFNTLWNILMILDRNVDQDEMTCRIQD